jgi:hypothetical protein
MKNSNLNQDHLNEMVSRFVALSLRQDEAEGNDDIRQQNATIRQRWALERVLAEAGPVALTRLVDLYTHKNIQVRLNAAIATLDFAPVEARRVLEVIKSWRIQPYAAKAWEKLDRLETQGR